jgi:hypothetical protein
MVLAGSEASSAPTRAPHLPRHSVRRSSGCYCQIVLQRERNSGTAEPASHHGRNDLKAEVFLLRTMVAHGQRFGPLPWSALRSAVLPCQRAAVGLRLSLFRFC